MSGWHEDMITAQGWTRQPATASTPRDAHACNCVGCCRRCGTCRTWFGHTPAYCDMIVRQNGERGDYLQSIAPRPASPAVTHTEQP